MMPGSDRRSIGDRGTRVALAALVAVCIAAFGGAVIAACGGDDSGAPSSVDRFAGDWAPVDARLEITWGESGKSYGISMAEGSHGGLAVEKNGDSYAATLVGVDGTRTEAFPATASGDTLTFDVPIIEGSPARVTLELTGGETATLSFGGDSSPWEFAKVDSIPTGTE